MKASVGRTPIWSMKNLVRVLSPITGPPRKKYARVCPTIGTASVRLVATVAPQKLICSKTSEYPVNPKEGDE